MPYIKPSFNLLPILSVDNSEDYKIAEEINKIIINCLAAFGINVESMGIKVSCINCIFDYRIGNGTKYKDVKQREMEVSVAVGNDVNIFTAAEQSNVFSISVTKQNRSYVYLRTLLESEEFKSIKSPLAIAVGVDERDKKICFDLKESPHLLISGTTGSGKTVFIDDIILSLIYNSTPDEVRLVLIDPDKKDLLAYSNVPHLMFPVITDKASAVEYINYLRTQMRKRYELFAERGVKTLESYINATGNSMPRIVIIIDKYIDMTIDVPGSFGANIEEIARKGRAAGIHLIINSQTAMNSVVSSAIKANIMCKATFSVTSWHESKAAQDSTGAQKLLGNGDMMLSLGNGAKQIHVQTAYVSESEIRTVVNEVCRYNERVQYTASIKTEHKDIDEDAEYAINILLTISNMKKVSVDSIQRNMDVGYSEAVDIIDFLERKGVISRLGFRKGHTVNKKRLDELIKRL